jgi:hypothetical protein
MLTLSPSPPTAETLIERRRTGKRRLGEELATRIFLYFAVSHYHPGT